MSGSSSAAELIETVPILALSGQLPGAFGAEAGLGIGAGALAVGGVGVDRQPSGKVRIDGADARRRGGEALGLRGADLRSRPEGESASVVVSAGLDGGVEGLAVASVIGG